MVKGFLCSPLNADVNAMETCTETLCTVLWTFIHITGLKHKAVIREPVALMN